MARDPLIAAPPRRLAAARGAWLPWSIAGLSFALYAASVALHVLARSAQAASTWGAADGSIVPVVFLPFLAFPVVGALIVSRHPENRIGWICLAAGIVWMFGMMSSFYAHLGLVARPGSVPFPLTIGALGVSLWVPALGLFGIYLILLFPDGRLPSRRWRPLAWLSGVAILLVSVAIVLDPGPIPELGGAPNPFGLEGRPTLTRVLEGTIVLLPLCILASVVSLVLRFRRSRGEVRQQIKWIAFAASVMAAAYLITLLITFAFEPESVETAGAQPPLWLGLVQDAGLLSYAGIPVAIGFAVLRYRLYDVDFVINRALVYGALTASVIAIYVLVVGYLGALFRTGGNLAISLVATGLVAVLFQPLRDRLQRGVNRLMYGERDEPYAVLSRLGERLEGTLAPEAVLPTVVEIVREALKLPYAAIRLGEHGESNVLSESGSPADDLLRLPLAYQGETVGELLLAPRAPGEEFSSADRRLLDGLARQAGIAVHAVRLTADLRHSRERLVTAREEERRRLRRDLHDGLGPTLGSLPLELDVADDLLEVDPAAARELLRGLKSQAKSAVADIRRLVYELRPPALDDLGLVGAIRETAAQYGANGLRVTVETPDDLPPLPAAVEVAAYRIVQEALTNVVRHAAASECVVSLAVGDNALQLEISDDGRGVSPEKRRGVGIASMRERAEELGGACVVESPDAPGGGTRVRAALPTPVTPGGSAPEAET